MRLGLEPARDGDELRRRRRAILAQADAHGLDRPERPDAHLHRCEQRAWPRCSQSPLNQPIPPPGNATLRHAASRGTGAPAARYAFRRRRRLRDRGRRARRRPTRPGARRRATGPQIHIDHLGPSGPAFDDIDISVAHHYNDTFSVRAGGAYNTRLSVGVAHACGSAPTTTSPRRRTTRATRASTSTRSTRSPAPWAWASSGTASSSTWATPRSSSPSRTVAPGDGADPPHRRRAARRPGRLAGQPAPGGQRGHVLRATRRSSRSASSPSSTRSSAPSDRRHGARGARRPLRPPAQGRRTEEGRGQDGRREGREREWGEEGRGRPRRASTEGEAQARPKKSDWND